MLAWSAKRRPAFNIGYDHRPARADVSEYPPITRDRLAVQVMKSISSGHGIERCRARHNQDRCAAVPQLEGALTAHALGPSTQVLPVPSTGELGDTQEHCRNSPHRRRSVPAASVGLLLLWRS